MKVRFHRSRLFEVISLDPRARERRGFFFTLSVGFEAPVDPMSGMTVNLVHVDRWLSELAVPVETDDIWFMMHTFGVALEKRAEEFGARLSRIEIRDGDSWWAREKSLCERGFVREQLKPADVLRPVLREFVLRSPDPAEDPPLKAIDDFNERAIDESVPNEFWGWSLAEIRESDLAGQATINFKF